MTDYVPYITEVFYYVFHNTGYASDIALLSGPISEVLERSNVKHMPKRYTNVAIFSRHRDACKYYGVLMGRVRSPVLPTVVPSPASSAPAAAAVSEPPRRMQRMRLRTLVRS